jgi:hypothetical protein
VTDTLQGLVGAFRVAMRAANDHHPGAEALNRASGRR